MNLKKYIVCIRQKRLQRVLIQANLEIKLVTEYLFANVHLFKEFKEKIYYAAHIIKDNKNIFSFYFSFYTLLIM